MFWTPDGPQIWFWAPVAKVVLFYYTPISNLSISGSWGSLGCFGHPDGLQIWLWAPVVKVVLFYCTAISKLSISSSWGSLGLSGPSGDPTCSVGQSVGVWWWGPRRRRRQISNFIIENEVPDLGHGRVGCWDPCLDEFVGFVLGFISLILSVGGSGGSGP